MTVEQMFEGISAGTPQCDVRSQSDEQCEWSSVVRYRTQCSDCDHASITFMCPGHKRGLEAGEVVCYHCKSPKVFMKVS